MSERLRTALERQREGLATLRTFQNVFLVCRYVIDRRDMVGEGNLDAQILDYVGKHHLKNGQVPSMRSIIRKFRRAGMNNAEFYLRYPGGLGQVCREAGIPAPDRLKYTAKALEARAKKSRQMKKGEVGNGVGSSQRLLLTDEQERRLFGLSHFEGGKDPHLILSEILNRDGMVCKLLSFAGNMGKLISFVEQAVAKGWGVPELLEATTRLCNIGFAGMEPEKASRVHVFLEDLQKRKWDVLAFVDYATKHHNAIFWYNKYVTGEITLEELEVKVRSV